MDIYDILDGTPLWCRATDTRIVTEDDGQEDFIPDEHVEMVRDRLAWLRDCTLLTEHESRRLSSRDTIVDGEVLMHADSEDGEVLMYADSEDDDGSRRRFNVLGRSHHGDSSGIGRS